VAILFAAPETGSPMLRGIWAVLVLIVASTICGVPTIIASLLNRRSDAVVYYMHLWSRMMLSALNSRVEYEGLEHLGHGEPRIFVSNHLSNVDIWALGQVLPPKARFVAKQELRKVPIVGGAMAASGMIFIDRANRSRAIKSLKLAAEQIRAGRPVVMFAEGTRSRDGRLHPFKKGPFHLALVAGVPVVPVAISGSWGILKPRSLVVTPGVVRVQYLEPVDVSPWQPDDARGLTEHVHGLVREALAETEVETA
jgi:1-acyl-sn-glycerol-3-phosphate acyltransferase